VNSSAKLTSTLPSAEAERGLSRCFARTHLSEKGISRYTCAAVATWSPVVHWKEILVIIAMTVCSLMLNGPGLRSIEEPPSQRGSCKVCRGKAQAMKRPKGYARSLVWFANVGRSRKFPHVSLTYSPARGSNTGPGPRREKNVLIVAPATAKKRPMKSDRTVKAVCGGKR
jgi:hypothetical protein